jgi:4-amino-4-deoxy-L-arabinose transferase-like glycosyltransferase
MDHNANSSSRMIYWVIALGIGIRVFAAVYTYVINPDGMVYIQQAKAIYHHHWLLLKSCVPFVSSYPFLIAGTYWIFPSWIDSARFVSILFGSLTLVPLYFLLRRFTDGRATCLSVLLYAFMPVLVGGSADLVRDPICWFFLVSGLYFFVRQMEKKETLRRRLYYLTSSYFLFLMAGWARPETFLVLIFSCFYTFAYSLLSGEKRYLFVAFSSLLLLGAFLVAGGMIFNPSFSGYAGRASNKLSASVEEYRNLRQQMQALAQGLDRGVLRSFLSKAGSLIWLNDLGLLVRSSIAFCTSSFFLVASWGPLELKKLLNLSGAGWVGKHPS